MDWLIYYLVGNVVTNYWYDVQCKVFGFIQIKKHKGIVCSVIIRAHAILDANILICPNGDITYLGSMNNKPNMWTIYSLESKWAQCDYPIAWEDMIYKHIMKVSKMLHPDIKDGVIVREARILHCVDCYTPMSKCYSTLSHGASHGDHTEQLAIVVNDNTK